MTLEEALNGWRWDGADGAALALAFAQGEKAGRGILFCGTVGSGKTLAANLLAKKRNGLFIDCSVPEKAAALATWRDWALPGRAIVLDELGRDTVRNDFGNRTDVVATFVRDLHAAWKAREWSGRLYVTTNLTASGLVEAYDESIADRLLELCVVCHFTQGRRVAAADAGPVAPVRETDTVGAEDAAREDAIWAAVLAARKAGDRRGTESLTAQNELGVFEVAWRVAVFDLRVWGEADCAAVDAAWRANMGRPVHLPRYELESGYMPGLKKSPRMARIRENARLFDLPNALYDIAELFRFERYEDARWYARRTAAWCRKAVGELPTWSFPAARNPDEAIDWEYWVRECERQRGIGGGNAPSGFGKAVLRELDEITNGRASA